jgi:hypothetical protein
MAIVVSAATPQGRKVWAWPLAGLALWLSLALPEARATLENSMAWHMLAQIPLLAVAGALFAPAAQRWLPPSTRAYNQLGLTGVAVAVLAGAHWMLPRALDSALAEPMTELVKFVSVPSFVGLPLALSWRRLPPLGKGVVWAHFLSMLGVVGWLYLAAPVRLCNYYLADQQAETGILMLLLAAALTLLWFVGAMAGLGMGQTRAVSA